MTSSIELDRLVGKVLRAPRGERWETLLNIHVCDQLDVVNELVDRLANSQVELEKARKQLNNESSLSAELRIQRFWQLVLTRGMEPGEAMRHLRVCETVIQELKSETQKSG